MLPTLAPPAPPGAAALSLGTHAHLSIGPWFLRNVHPTTTVVHPVLATFDHTDTSALPSAAMLLLSNRGAWLLQADGPGRRKLEMALEGAPTAATTLRGGGRAAVAAAASLVLVADAAGSLCLLDCGPAGTHLRISTSTPLPVASCMAHLPRWLDGGSNAVFVGSSTSGGSAILEVPVNPLDPAAVWAVEGPLLPSLAPVQHAQLISDPAGSGDARLLCCCGSAPSGRLALAGLAAALQPLAEGQRLPGQVHLLPLAPAPGAVRDSHLLLSVGKEGGSGATLVLAAEGGSFAEAMLPGLQTDMATLLVAPMPAGCLLQVTPREARVVRPAGGGALVSCWAAGDAAITLAAAHGQYLLLATGEPGVDSWRGDWGLSSRPFPCSSAVQPSPGLCQPLARLYSLPLLKQNMRRPRLAPALGVQRHSQATAGAAPVAAAAGLGACVV